MVKCKFLSLLIYDIVGFLTFYYKIAMLRLLSCHQMNAIRATFVKDSHILLRIRSLSIMFQQKLRSKLVRKIVQMAWFFWWNFLIYKVRLSSTGVCWLAFILLFLAFYAGNFNFWQDLAVFIVTVIVACGIVAAMWIRWALG